MSQAQYNASSAPEAAQDWHATFFERAVDLEVDGVRIEISRDTALKLAHAVYTMYGVVGEHGTAQ
jgi:uncharacterized protein YcbX